MSPWRLCPRSHGETRPLDLSGASAQRERAAHTQPDCDQSPARRSIGARGSRGVGPMAKHWPLLSAHPGREFHSVRLVVPPCTDGSVLGRMEANNAPSSKLKSPSPELPGASTKDSQ